MYATFLTNRRVTFGIVEKILSTDSPKSITYTIVSGSIPLKTHLGEVTFEEVDGKTVINWQCTFTPYYGVGWLMTPIIRFSFKSMLSHLNAIIEKTAEKATE